MPSDKAVLMYVHDRHLADSRRMVLEQAGFQVQVTDSPNDLLAKVDQERSSYAVLLICHTVPPEEDPFVRATADRMKAQLFCMARSMGPLELIAEVRRFADRNASDRSTPAAS